MKKKIYENSDGDLWNLNVFGLVLSKLTYFLNNLIEDFSCSHHLKINKIGNSAYNGAFYAN